MNRIFSVCVYVCMCVRKHFEHDSTTFLMSIVIPGQETDHYPEQDVLQFQDVHNANDTKSLLVYL